MEFKEYKLRDIVDVLNKIINPQKNKNTNFSLYSLPAFDNNKTPEICKGEQINSSKLIIDRQAILFNKLNIRFKRIWNLTSINSNSICSMEFIPLVANQKIILNDYLYYLLISDGFNKGLIENSTGTSNSHQRINKEILLEKNIYLPSIENQKKITYILKSIDKKIELNNQINKNLLEIGLLLVNKYFAKERNRISLKNVIKFTKGKKPKSITNVKQKDYEKYLTIACLNNKELNYADVDKMITADKHILMVMDGASSGDIYYSHYGVVGSTLARIDIITKSFNKEYIYFCLKKYSELIKSKNTGSAIPHTDKVFVNSLEIPKIDIEEQQSFISLLSKIEENKKENHILEQLQNTILPKLMKGQIKLEKIEI